MALISFETLLLLCKISQIMLQETQLLDQQADEISPPLTKKPFMKEEMHMS